MNPSPRRVSLVLTLLAVAGCTLNKSELRRDNILTRIGGSGQVIEPKRCALQVAFLMRPLRDEALDVCAARASGPVRCEAMGVCVGVTRHVIMAASANASVTRMKTAAVLSDMSHIWSPDLSGPPH